jgi:hypothetical protein
MIIVSGQLAGWETGRMFRRLLAVAADPFFLDLSMTRSLVPPTTPRQDLCFLLVLAGFLLVSQAKAQFVPSKAAPHDGYWECFASFYDGDFRTAGKGFREASKDGVMNISLTVPGPWVDAICYHA